MHPSIISLAQWLVRCSAAGSIPARRPTLGPAGRIFYLPRRRSLCISSSGRYPVGEVHPDDEYCINVFVVRKIQK
jgi:hypothetical protein